VGRIIPIVHASEDGKDGRVHIEFYAKPNGSPSVELAWTDAQGKRHRQSRDLWVLQGAMQPRLVGARATAPNWRAVGSRSFRHPVRFFRHPMQRV
jgi:hypothetical protein